MATTQTFPTVSWAALQNTKQWESLTPQQRIWCLAFIANGGDLLDATKTAYKCKSERSFSCLSFEVRKHPNVVSFLELYRVLTQGVPSREEQVADLLDAIRNTPPYAQGRPRLLLAQLTGSRVERKKHQEEDESEPDSVASIETESPRVPAGATPLLDAQGVVRGYKTSDGEYFQLADVEAE